MTLILRWNKAKKDSIRLSEDIVSNRIAGTANDILSQLITHIQENPTNIMAMSQLMD